MGSVDADEPVGGAKDDVIDDERLEYMANYVTKSLRCSDTKWSKMYKEEENKKQIQRYESKFTALHYMYNAEK